MPKAKTKTDLEERIRFAEGVLIREFSDGPACELISAEYGIARRTARTYLKQVRDKWSEEVREQINGGEELRRVKRIHMGHTLCELYRSAFARGDLRTAEKVLSRIAQLDGLDAPPEAPENDTSGLTAEELLKRLAVALITQSGGVRKAAAVLKEVGAD